jgi:hypothetical protein
MSLSSKKVFDQAFFKKLADSKGRALVARRNERNLLYGVSLFLTFLFAPSASKRKVDKQVRCRYPRRANQQKSINSIGRPASVATFTKCTSICSLNKKLRPITLTYFLGHDIIFSINFDFFCKKVKYFEIFGELISRNNAGKELL